MCYLKRALMARATVECFEASNTENKNNCYLTIYG